MRTWILPRGASVLAALALLLMPVESQPTAYGASASGSYSSGNLSVAIPDLGTASSTISVPDTGTVSNVTVRVRLNHPSDRDLNLDLVGPDGTTATLALANAVDGQNFGSGANGCGGSFTQFDDDATTPIYAGVAPFVGAYSPVDLLDIFDGHASNGTWTLRISDEVSQDAGTLYCWQLDVTRDTSGASPAPNPSPSPSPSPAPADPAGCSPRPAVVTTATPSGNGQMRVTISASGASNRLQALRVGAMSNARVDVVGGPSGVAAGTSVPLNGVTSVTLLVTRLTPGSVTVPLTVTDGCGDWPTFVGGGAGAF